MLEPISFLAAVAAALSYFIPGFWPQVIMLVIAGALSTFSFFYFWRERPGNILMFLCIIFCWLTIFVHIYLGILT
jgi:hypothetical protein